ncbi:uncharacterized protein LOC130970004 [Arachis stenosperma]|uniref:uncharacterized protein LOC130970004 n=1 Tax=Arachis stenosperma TaxID=217475 RepID=UPI0025AC75CE|nr:uncharacterized protein LOC130970004 [Arachis stenosperma]
MGKKQSLRSKAAHFVSDLTTVLLNPISDNLTNSNNNKPSPPLEEAGEFESESRGSESEGIRDLVDGPDTSSFAAFLYSFLSSSDSDDHADPDGQVHHDIITVADDPLSDLAMKENVVLKKSLLFTAIHQAASMGGFLGNKRKHDDGNRSNSSEVEMGQIQLVEKQPVTDLVDEPPETSEPSMLISAAVRNAMYASLPSLVQGRKWMLLYSTWRHGASLATLYRRSMLWPGLSLLVVGDRQGAVFGGLVEAPLRPSTKKKYQGTNSSFVFTNTSGHPVIYRPTGKNRYFTLCTSDFLAIGGGSNFALYLEDDLMHGSSSVSETYGNPCLAHSREFEVKEVELWGFVFSSQYEEIVALSKTEAPGICHW